MIPKVIRPKTETEFIIGIDEAGRGPLFGPVSVGTVLVDDKVFKKLRKSGALHSLTDSKKLSEKERERLYEELVVLQKNNILKFTCALVSAKIIDTKGISFAIKSGIQKNLRQLLGKTWDKKVTDSVKILLDGSLRAPAEFTNQKTIIKGDLKEPIISAASIIAKVTRDRVMHKIARLKKYADYKIDVHKGYGTAMHRQLIQKYGLSDMHRKSFCKNVSSPLPKKH